MLNISNVAALSSWRWRDLRESTVMPGEERLNPGSGVALVPERSKQLQESAASWAARRNRSWRIPLRIAFSVAYKDSFWTDGASIWRRRSKGKHSCGRESHTCVFFDGSFVCFAHLSKHLYCLVEKVGLHFFGHWQEVSSTVEDAQQGQSVSLPEG